MTEQTKNFLLYGIEAHIKPKEIYKLDGAMLFFIFLLFFLVEASPSPGFFKNFSGACLSWNGYFEFFQNRGYRKEVFLDLWNTKPWIFASVLLGRDNPYADDPRRKIISRLSGCACSPLHTGYRIVYSSHPGSDKKRCIQSLHLKKNGWWLVRNGFCNTWNQCCENPQRPGRLYSHHTVCKSWLLFYFPALHPGCI